MEFGKQEIFFPEQTLHPTQLRAIGAVTGPQRVLAKLSWLLCRVFYHQLVRDFCYM
jgi:hypothetical protein